MPPGCAFAHFILHCCLRTMTLRINRPVSRTVVDDWDSESAGGGRKPAPRFYFLFVFFKSLLFTLDTETLHVKGRVVQFFYFSSVLYIVCVVLCNLEVLSVLFSTRLVQGIE